ncbi:c-type cytochrome [Brumimicrobium aurantiacum]|uniref:Cytochrome c domain-containing protein n=1 Tax=Brumimicrobium aurantiacum TaxID=1737063 RepID=A0A3E1EYG5_9FLAO|nr:c-type cytochrome [Brumimicrobium aurantiacum]RFC54600.1 hypothetical protein DXU93_06320 [Brumimicrobium aurantiacum]
MRNSVYNLSILLLGLSLYAIQNLKVEENISSFDNLKNSDNVLALYGKEIYKTQRCDRCHVLNIEDEKFFKKSIDGVGEARSSVYLTQLIQDPQSVNPGTRMPSFDHLFSNELTKDQLNAIINSNNLKIELETAWTILNEQSTKILSEINADENFDLKKSEGISLIAYLKSFKKVRN